MRQEISISELHRQNDGMASSKGSGNAQESAANPSKILIL